MTDVVYEIMPIDQSASASVASDVIHVARQKPHHTSYLSTGIVLKLPNAVYLEHRDGVSTVSTALLLHIR